MFYVFWYSWRNINIFGNRPHRNPHGFAILSGAAAMAVVSLCCLV